MGAPDLAISVENACTGWAETLTVPGGTLRMGSDEVDIDACVEFWRNRLLSERYVDIFRSWIEKEAPKHSVVVSLFQTMRFPVTNGAYRAFLETSDVLIPESIALGLPDDHPVWGVDRAHAERFACWWRDIDSKSWRLPTEVEWEWMASGPDKLQYPYGHTFDERCANTIESGYGCTTPVDAHPQGRSWCGVFDLAGNVEEWTSSRYAPYPGGSFVHDDLVDALGPTYPILRGGSYMLGGDLSRCARRHGPHPGTPFRITGFRLVHEGGHPS